MILNKLLFPEIIQLQTFSLCNNSCPYCPYPDVKNEVPMGKMPTLTIKRIIDEFIDKGGSFFIPYLQNEPLLDERFLSILDFIRDKSDIPIEISSNCILLNAKMRGCLIKYSNIQFVLHLNKFNTKESENARQFLNLEPENVIVTIFKGYTSDTELEKWLEYAKKNDINLKIINPSSRSGNVDIHELKPHIFRKVFNYFQSKSCSSLRSRKWIHILWNGTVILCCQDWRREVVLGNINNSSIEEVFNNNLFSQIRKYILGENTPSDFICRKCNFWVPHETLMFKKKIGTW